MSDDTDAEEHDEASREGDDAPEPPPRRYAFSLAAIAGLAIWKVYEALAADTMQAAIAPSLYTMGLAGFAVSILGPKSLQLVTFLAGAALCVGAIAIAAHA
jgi:hypothetical protein